MTTAILLVGGLLLAGLVVTAITHWVHGIDDYIDRHINDALNAEVDAEWNAWVDEALRLSETPIFDQLARQRFEADALAEIDEMTGGVA